LKCCIESLCCEPPHEFNVVVSSALHRPFGFSESFIVQEIGLWDKIEMLLRYVSIDFQRNALENNFRLCVYKLCNNRSMTAANERRVQ
jgi:hypothetical protein